MPDAGYFRGVSSTRTSRRRVPAHCLVVDDDAQVRQALARVLQGHGLATVEAGSGAEALAILEREGEVPLVISDIYMPEMDGITFLREALRRYPDMAVIMLTGVAEVTTAVECLQLGRARLHLEAGRHRGGPGAGGQGAREAPARARRTGSTRQNLEGRVRELDRRNKESLINGVQMLVHASRRRTPTPAGTRPGWPRTP